MRSQMDVRGDGRSSLDVLKGTSDAKSLSEWFADENVTRKAYLNAIAAGLEYGARLAIGFLLNPLVVALVAGGILLWSFRGGVTGSCLGFMAGPGCVTALLFVLVLSVGESLTARTWISLILSAGATSAVALPVSSFTGLSSDDRKPVLGRVRLATRPAACG